MKTNKKTVRLTEADLQKMIDGVVKKVLNETIGDGSFPNADALIGHKVKDVESALYKEGFVMDEYGDDQYGNGEATQVHHIFPKSEFPQIAHY